MPTQSRLFGLLIALWLLPATILSAQQPAVAEPHDGSAPFVEDAPAPFIPEVTHDNAQPPVEPESLDLTHQNGYGGGQTATTGMVAAPCGPYGCGPAVPWWSTGCKDCPGNTCGHSACCACFLPRLCGPAWRFTADAVLLDRSTAGAVAFVRDSTSGAGLLSSAGLRFVEEPGWRASVFRDMPDYSIELSYLSNDWLTRQQAFSAGNLTGVIGSLDYDFADSIINTYESELQSAEVNFYGHVCGGFSWLAGFRMMTVDELLRMEADNAGSVSNYLISTDNDLYGLQMGAAYRAPLPNPWKPWCLTRISFDSSAKAGVFYGDIQRSIDFRDGNNAPDIAFTDGRQDAVVAGEINVGLTARILPQVLLRGGYQLLWVEGIAMAPEQFLGDRAAIAAPPELNSGGLFADGFYFGGEIVF